jgi:hypothetical protein
MVIRRATTPVFQMPESWRSVGFDQRIRGGEIVTEKDLEAMEMIRDMDDNPVMRIVLVDYPSEPSANVSQ